MKTSTIIFVGLSGIVNMGSAYYMMDLKSRLELAIDASRAQRADIDELRKQNELSDARSLKAFQICEDLDTKAGFAIQLAAKTFCQVNPKLMACRELK